MPRIFDYYKIVLRSETWVSVLCSTCLCGTVLVNQGGTHALPTCNCLSLCFLASNVVNKLFSFLGNISFLRLYVIFIFLAICFLEKARTRLPRRDCSVI